MQTRYRAPFESIDVRLETMAQQGIDMQVISHMPNFGYWADRNVAEQIVDAANTYIADLCRTHPDKFVGLCLVALQFPERAARQLESAMGSMGMRGVEIGTRLDDAELDAEQLEPFWAAAEQLGALIFIHPAGSTLGRRLDKYYLSNVIGNPRRARGRIPALVHATQRPRLRSAARSEDDPAPAN
jgi:aminocarboxymuconate-semialdehyde decarboxylase